MDFKKMNIPDHVLESIRGASAWEDGDTWILGKGRFLEYDLKSHSFQLKEQGSVVRSIPFRKVMRW